MKKIFLPLAVAAFVATGCHSTDEYDTNAIDRYNNQPPPANEHNTEMPQEGKRGVGGTYSPQPGVTNTNERP